MRGRPARPPTCSSFARNPTASEQVVTRMTTTPQESPTLAVRGVEQALRRGAGPGRRLARPAARVGARPGRGERRRQVDADQGDDRRVPARRGRGALRAGEPVQLRLAARRAAGRASRRSTRRSTSRRSCRVARNLFLGREPQPPRLDRPAPDEPEAQTDPRALRHRRRRPAPARRARSRRPADGRARPGRLHRRPRRHHGRADVVARAARGRARCSRWSRCSRSRASPSSTSRHKLDEVFRGLRHGHRAARRPARLHRTDRGARHRGAARSR